MKSRELYSGAAPSAMGQMGSGLMEMGANVGRITASGYEAMGKGIASGISSVGQAYGTYKEKSADAKNSERFFTGMEKSGYLPEGISKGIREHINSEDYKHASTEDKYNFWKLAKSFIGESVKSKLAIDRSLLTAGYVFDNSIAFTVSNDF